MAPRTRSQRNTPLDAAHPADPAAPVGQQGETLEMQTAELQSLQKAFAGFEQRGHDTKPMVVLVKGSVIFAPAPLPRALSIIMVLVLTALLVQFTLPGAGEHIRDLAIASCHSAIDTFLFLIDLNHQSVTVVRVFFTEAYLTLLDRVQGVGGFLYTILEVRVRTRRAGPPPIVVPLPAARCCGGRPGVLPDLPCIPMMDRTIPRRGPDEEQSNGAASFASQPYLQFFLVAMSVCFRGSAPGVEKLIHADASPSSGGRSATRSVRRMALGHQLNASQADTNSTLQAEYSTSAGFLWASLDAYNGTGTFVLDHTMKVPPYANNMSPVYHRRSRTSNHNNLDVADAKDALGKPPGCRPFAEKLSSHRTESRRGPLQTKAIPRLIAAPDLSRATAGSVSGCAGMPAPMPKVTTTTYQRPGSKHDQNLEDDSATLPTSVPVGLQGLTGAIFWLATISRKTPLSRTSDIFVATSRKEQIVSGRKRLPTKRDQNVHLISASTSNGEQLP
ncbi:hypothetical protein BV25DRAFT_1841612 [Artomyces pyxidatus]|uniref:Uncharacterized protein n=1 Tax=Artomyces pyxidatus TaxID=48021 RepID=A0ACB8SMR9_9AGAM|nr:hypothetical protein BV25DRAFT_1841612 [Artomyces pyxidatus]